VMKALVKHHRFGGNNWVMSTSIVFRWLGRLINVFQV
jgi:hypothetical protein